MLSLYVQKSNSSQSIGTDYDVYVDNVDTVGRIYDASMVGRGSIVCNSLSATLEPARLWKTKAPNSLLPVFL